MTSEVLARNIVGNECMNFANIDKAAVKEAARGIQSAIHPA